jgi:hypothetical protein
MSTSKLFGPEITMSESIQKNVGEKDCSAT